MDAIAARKKEYIMPVIIYEKHRNTEITVLIVLSPTLKDLFFINFF